MLAACPDPRRFQVPECDQRETESSLGIRETLARPLLPLGQCRLAQKAQRFALARIAISGHDDLAGLLEPEDWERFASYRFFTTPSFFGLGIGVRPSALERIQSTSVFEVRLAPA